MKIIPKEVIERYIFQEIEFYPVNTDKWSDFSSELYQTE